MSGPDGAGKGNGGGLRPEGLALDVLNAAACRLHDRMAAVGTGERMRND